MSDPAKTRSVRRVLRWTAGVLALVLLYPLSIGPVWYLTHDGILPANTLPFDAVYEPLWNLTEGTALEKPVRRYWWCWIVLKYPGLEQLRRDLERQQAAPSPHRQHQNRNR